MQSESLVQVWQAILSYAAHHPGSIIMGLTSSIAALRVYIYYVNARHYYDRGQSLRDDARHLLARKPRSSRLPTYHLAAQEEDLVRLKQHIRLFKDLNAQDLLDQAYHHKTALHLAATIGKSESVKMLLEAGVDPMKMDQNNETFFVRAIANGKRAVVKIGLGMPEADALMNTANKWGYSPLMVAIFSGQPEIGLDLVKAGCSLDSNPDGLDPYVASCYQAGPEYSVLAASILRRSATAKDPLVFGPLCDAILSHQASRIEDLLQKGMSPLSGLQGITPLGYAAQKGALHVLKLMRPTLSDAAIKQVYKGRLTPLHLAAQDGVGEQGKAVLDYLMAQYPFDINAKSGSLNTPLHVAARASNLDTLTHLLAKGAEPNRKNGYGETPLHLGVRRNNIPLVRCLLMNNAEPDIQNNEFQSASQLADLLGHTQSKRLIEKWHKYQETEPYLEQYFQVRPSEEMANRA